MPPRIPLKTCALFIAGDKELGCVWLFLLCPHVFWLSKILHPSLGFASISLSLYLVFLLVSGSHSARTLILEVDLS